MSLNASYANQELDIDEPLNFESFKREQRT
jgi:hypothetical protein